MSDVTVQGRPRLYKRYASAVESQGLHVSRGSEGGCGRVESKRGMQGTGDERASLTQARTYNPPRRWRRKRERPNPPSCRSLSEGEGQRISKRPIV